MGVVYMAEQAKPVKRRVALKVSVAANRRTEPKKLRTLVRGELDWIVMKALEKDRARRYDIASSFAADIERLLDDETVQACPPSTAYRIKKLAWRHRTALGTISMVVAALLLGLAGVGWQAARAARGERQTRAEGLVKSLPNSEVTKISAVPSELEDLRRWADPLLTTIARRSGCHGTKQLPIAGG
jgi:hypothetical protein